MTSTPHSKLRRAARLAAVQALYQMDVGEVSSQTVITEFQNHHFGMAEESGYVEADEEFFEDLIQGVIKFQDDIDQEISNHLSKNWRLARLDKTLRSIMRAGVYELSRRPDVPALVVIDQYVSITIDFFDDKETGFVNGIMEKIAKKIRRAEFGLIGENS